MKQQNKQFNKLFLDGFWLKIIAIISMTLDHLGYSLEIFYGEISTVATIANIFRQIGRLALPIFCFLIVEGVIHTKSFKKYIFNLSIIGVAVLIAQIVMEYGLKISINQGNIFLDLILGAIAVKCLMDKRIWIKLIALLPVGFGILSFAFYGFEQVGNPIFHYFPYFLRAQYYWYSIGLIILFYLSYVISKWLFNNTSSITGLDYEMVKDGKLYRFVTNSISALFVVVLTILLYVSSFFLESDFIFWDIGLQNFALISGALLLFYNGKRGYNNNVFKYGCYLYYPLHILIVYGLVYLIYIF